MERLFGGIYRGKRVFLTGHTGFKGSWLACWLTQMGAEVTGYSLGEPTHPCHLRLLGPDIESIDGDIRNMEPLDAALSRCRPHVIFHLAAQAIVRQSYDDPMGTFLTNVQGTLNVLEACRKEGSARAIVCVTSDKVYENREWAWGYRENDRLGGRDPYSASKACAELAVSSYRKSFLDPAVFGSRHHALVATARAGNVVGGGDWAADRLVPDIARACSRGETVRIRNPGATRPWQHVLECLSGYLLLGQRMLEGRVEAARAWNFGPSANSDLAAMSVQSVVEAMAQHWSDLRYEVRAEAGAPHEARALALDSTLARAGLGWKPVWDTASRTFARTASWYRDYYATGAVGTLQDLGDYAADARAAGLPWAN